MVMNKLHLQKAIAACKAGGVIAYPAEAVFGLGCIPTNEHSVHRILKLKRRSIRKGLILIAGEITQLEEFVDFSKVKNLKAVFHAWPGPVTWLIPARRMTPIWLTGEHSTLAVRVSSYDLIKSLCSELGPIVSTSANPHNALPARSSQRVRAYFPRGIDYVIPAKIANNENPSEIRDAQTGNILRSS
mgnify:CR=1 FL=1